MKKLFFNAILALLLLPVANVIAGDTECTGLIISEVLDNVIVPEGAGCVLADCIVEGNVKVLEGANLTLNGTEVGGNVEADGALYVDAFASDIGGDFLNKSSALGSFLCDNEIRENVQFEENAGTTIVIGHPTLGGCTGNHIGGDLQIFKQLQRFLHNHGDSPHGDIFQGGYEL